MVVNGAGILPRFQRLGGNALLYVMLEKIAARITTLVVRDVDGDPQSLERGVRQRDVPAHRALAQAECLRESEQAVEHVLALTRRDLRVGEQPLQLACARAVEADAVELHTGTYCEAAAEGKGPSLHRELARLQDGARQAAAAGGVDRLSEAEIEQEIQKARAGQP